MSKVELTREQAEAIESLLEQSKENKERVMDEHANAWSKGEWVGRNAMTLNRLLPSIMAQALYVGYEIKEEFKVGDWVYYNDGGEVSIVKIIRLDEEKDRVIFDVNVVWFPIEYIERHATPEEIAGEKERRWWAKYNRKVWEIQEGDCLISKHDKSSCQVKFVEASDEVSVLLVDGIQDEFYEGEHDLKIMRDRYDVFCFAEDRKDE